MAKIVVFVIAILAILAFFMSGKSEYFDCTGTMTSNGSEKSKQANNVSLKTEMVPWLNRIIFRPEYLGTAAFNSHRLYLHIFDVTDINVMMKDASGGKGMAVFDRVSRHLILNDGRDAYDLICKPTESASI